MKPLLAEIFDALRARGWTVDNGYVSPEGDRYADLSDAILAQSMREIGKDPSGRFSDED